MTPFFNQVQLNVLVDLQDTLNTKTIGLGWVDQNKPFMLAAGMEAAEAIEHHGWKWWKHQEVNQEQLQMELIDILHFVISEAIQTENTEYLYRKGPATVSYVTLVDILRHLAASAFATDGSLDDVIYYLYAAFVKAEMTPEFIYTTYIGKNVLNTFRQNNGYKEGTYNKIWDGREDNEHLQDILKTLNLESPSISEDLYKALTAAYEIYA